MLQILPLSPLINTILIVASIVIVVTLSAMAALLLFRSNRAVAKDKLTEKHIPKKTKVISQAPGSVQDSEAKEKAAKVKEPAKFETPQYSFRVSDLNAFPAQTEAGAEVTISCKLTNEGNAIGEYTAELRLNGEVVKRQTILLFGGKTRVITFSHIVTLPGNYNVEIGDLRETLSIVPKRETDAVKPEEVKQEMPVYQKTNYQAPGYSEIKLSNLKIEPSAVRSGQKATVSFLVTNQSQIEQEYEAELIINGQAMGRRAILLDPGQQQRVFFQGAMDMPGEHSIQIGDLKGVLNVSE